MGMGAGTEVEARIEKIFASKNEYHPNSLTTKLRSGESAGRFTLHCYGQASCTRTWQMGGALGSASCSTSCSTFSIIGKRGSLSRITPARASSPQRTSFTTRTRGRLQNSRQCAARMIDPVFPIKIVFYLSSWSYGQTTAHRLHAHVRFSL